MFNVGTQTVDGGNRTVVVHNQTVDGGTRMVAGSILTVDDGTCLLTVAPCWSLAAPVQSIVAP
jgi:hypothetical protein